MAAVYEGEGGDGARTSQRGRIAHNELGASRSVVYFGVIVRASVGGTAAMGSEIARYLAQPRGRVVEVQQ